MSWTPQSPEQSTNSQCRDLWAEALDKLVEEEKIRIQETVPGPGSGTNSPLDMLDELLQAAKDRRDECSRKRWKFQIRGRTIILRDLMDKMIIWINTFKAAGDVAANFDAGYFSLPWAGVRFLLQLAVCDSQQMGAILVELEKIGYLLSRCKLYELFHLRGKPEDQATSNLVVALTNLYAEILRFLSRAIQLYRRRTASRTVHAFFHPDKVADHTKRFRTLEERVDTEAGVCESAARRSMRGTLDEREKHLMELLEGMRQPLVRVDSRMSDLDARLSDKERTDTLCWASSIPFGENHYTARKGRTEETGLWLLRHELYHEWRASSASMILWMHGCPGAGKTKLVSTVVDDMLCILNSKPNSEAVAYFYCDRNQSGRRSTKSILNSVVRQLSTFKDGDVIQPPLMQLYKEREKSAFASGGLKIEESRSLLRQLTELYLHTTIVIDALDECERDSRPKLVEALDFVVQESPNPVKVLISSRQDEDIRHRFEGGPNVGIKATDNKDDIAKFVTSKIQNWPAHWSDKIPPPLKEEVCKTLVEKSDGMFQWASLQLDQLFRTGPREADVRKYLGKLPKQLREAYDAVYEDIQSQEGSAPQIAERAFHWVMASQVPLTPQVLLGAVCQDPETNSVVPVDIDMEYVRDACRNLLLVDGSGHCRFSHLSVQEYLETRWSYSHVHAQVSKVCLDLLRHPEDSQDPEDAQDSLRGVFNYAMMYWSIHVREHDEEAIDQGLTAVRKCLGIDE